MTITQRFNSLLFGAFVCLAGLAGLFIFEMGRVYDAVNFSNANIIPSVLTLDDATRNFGRLRVRLYRHLLSSDPAKRRDVESASSVMSHENVACPGIDSNQDICKFRPFYYFQSISNHAE